jgi:hypothetical protein
MPAPIPERDRKVYFAGAGLSCALGLPNTPSLLEEILALAGRVQWLQSKDLPRRVREAIKYFYPDGTIAGFRPDVVDFFSALRTYIDVGAGLVGGFRDAAALYRDLKFAIAHLLIERIRAVDQAFAGRHEYLDQVVRPGNIVITSNWDVVIERFAQVKGVPLRFAGTRESELVLLKLHGSIDWCLGRDRASYPDGDFAAIPERMFVSNPYRFRVPKAADSIVRVRALETWSDAWRKIKSRTEEPFMVTMARGKSGDLGPLIGIWKDAYSALSRARTLEIVGYSMPPDDIEIRTLPRAGTQRGTSPSRIIVRNPAPDVHDRLRRYLHRDVKSNYFAVNAIG